MDKIKEKIFGLLVLIALAAIFIPMIFESAQREEADIAVKKPHTTHKTPAANHSAENGIIFKEESQTKSPEVSEQSVPQANAETPSAPTEHAKASSESTTASPVAKETRLNPEEKPQAAQAPVTTSHEVPVPKKAVPEGERKGWTLQLGTFADVENAKQLVQQLKSAGYPGYFNTVYLSGQVYSVVYVGPYVRKSDPERLRHIVESSFKVKGTLIHYETQ